MNVIESSKVTYEFPVLLLGDSLECIKLHLLFTLVELEILATWRASSMACDHDISTEIKNDHNNDDVMIMCILLVNITDFFCCELDSRYCGALSNRITECFKLF